jgi:hypothetical protein
MVSLASGGSASRRVRHRLTKSKSANANDLDGGGEKKPEVVHQLIQEEVAEEGAVCRFFSFVCVFSFLELQLFVGVLFWAGRLLPP